MTQQVEQAKRTFKRSASTSVRVSNVIRYPNTVHPTMGAYHAYHRCQLSIFHHNILMHEKPYEVSLRHSFQLGSSVQDTAKTEQ